MGQGSSKRRRLALVAGLLVLLVGATGAFASGQPDEETSETSLDVVRMDLERFLRKGATDRDEASKVEIELPPLASFQVDTSRYPGELRTELSSRAQTPYKGRVPVNVALYKGDRLLHRGIVSPYLRVSRKVVVARRDLTRGEILTESNVMLASKDATRLARDVHFEPAATLGLRLRRSLRQGDAVRSGQIEPVPLVERGDRVMLVLEAGGLQIQAAARAKQKGAVGEWIRVLNLDSKREILGQVGADGKVRIDH